MIKDPESGDQVVIKQRGIDRNVKIGMAVLFYFFVSMSLVFMNKRMLSTIGREFPLFVTWWQFVVALGLIYITGEIGRKVPAIKFFAAIEFRKDIAIKVLPVTVIFIGMVVFNNLCLKYVQVSFYQVARSMTIGFSILFSWTVLGKKTSVRAIACCAVVIFGFGIGSWGEADFSLKGLLFGVTSSIFVALYGIYVKKAIDALDGNKDILLIYNTILSIILLFPLIIVSGEMFVLLESEVITDPWAWTQLTVAGVFGLLINVASYLQISLTSPLTHNISGTVKACLQTVIGVFVYGNLVTAASGLGIFLVIFGSAVYSYVRKMEMDKKDANSSGK